MRTLQALIVLAAHAFAAPQTDKPIPGGDAPESPARYAEYQRAIKEASVAQSGNERRDLVKIPGRGSVTVVSWLSAADAKHYKTKDRIPMDTWVTIEPHLQEYCRNFRAAHPANEAALTERLEEHLGLPPASGSTVFLRIRLENPTTRTIFRPCSDPAISQVRCKSGPPDDALNPAYARWFYRQFYSAYGNPAPVLYPWTALGYTFDWALSAEGKFVRYGESEFVIPKGRRVKVLGTVGTAEYCR